MPGRGAIRWVANQVNRLRKAVSAYNRAITMMERRYSGQNVILPLRTTVADEMARINTRDQLYSRISQLGRILKKNRPDAQEVLPSGQIKFLEREIKASKRKVNERREELLRSIYPDYDEMTEQRQASVMAGKNLMPLLGEYFTGDDLQWLTEELTFGDRQYLDNYLSVWEDLHTGYEGYSEVKRIVNRFVRELPGAIEQILEGDDDEKEIYYIYEEGKSPDLDTFQNRHMNVYRFWVRQEQIWFGSR